MTKVISFSDIEQRIQERHENKKISVVGSFPLLDTVNEDAMLGNFSWYYTKSHAKDILRPFAYNFGSFLSTPSELARTYLELKYRRQRATRQQIEDFRRVRTAPLYALPIGYDEGAYIDIRSAFWQILQIVGWDADYYAGNWLGKQDTMEDFPFPDFKLSRNCLVTAGLPGEAKYWKAKDKQFKSVSTQNRVLNVGIWALVMDILHCVAWDAVAAGAVYVHTDGYICHKTRVQSVQEAIQSWGLESRIKDAGRVVVYGVGSYQVGEKATKNNHYTAPYDGLMLPSYNKWLKIRVKTLADRTNFKWTSDWQTKIKSHALRPSQP